MKKATIYLIALIFIAVAFVTISFASFNTNLYVNGSGVLRAQAEIRVTNIVNKAYHGEAIENFNPNFDVDKTNVSVNLPTSNSSVEYMVTVKNYGDRAFLPEIKVLSEVNPNVVITISDGTKTYNLPNNNMNYEFAANEEKTFTITISNKPGTTNNNVVVSLEYEFMHDDVTAPGIARDGNNVELVIPGTSTFAVDHYEYYYNTSGTTPNDNASSNGNTNGTLSINAINEGHYFIWYRTVSTKNTKSVWSNRVEVIKTFTITYNPNCSDAECNPSSFTKNYGEAIGTLCAPTCTGHIFNHWEDQDHRTVTASTVVEKDLTLTGHWDLNMYLVTANGNSGLLSSQSGWTLSNDSTNATKNVYYKAIIGTLPTATRSGYTFTKWNTNQNGSGTDIDATTVMGASALTAYAIWHDSTKPVCTFGSAPTIKYGETRTVELTCTDNDSMSSQTLNASNFTTSNSSIITVTNVSSPVAVTGGYKYTVTLSANGTGEYTVSLNAASIEDTTGNKNEVSSLSGSVSQQTNQVTISPTSGTLTYGTNGSATITAQGDGTLSCTSSDETVATCSISGDTLTIIPGASNADNKTATITVTQASGTNYGVGSGTYTVTVNRITLTCPSKPADKTYNGDTQPSGIECPTGSTAGGDTEKTNVGTYHQTCSANNGYKFASACSVEWVIKPYATSITISPTSGGTQVNGQRTFVAKAVSIPACLGTLTATSADTTKLTITQGASTSITASNVNTYISVKYKGVGYTEGTKININYAVTDTSNCTSATQKQYTAIIARINQTVTLTEKTGMTYTGQAQAANTAFYKVYRASVTNYYYGSSYTSRTLYRDSYYGTATAYTTVLATSNTGTSNYSTATGPGSSAWYGLSTGQDTTREYSSVSATATSTATTLYTIYQFNIAYAKGSNVSAIGATSGSCRVTTSSTSCTVSLPTITPATGYRSVGWSTTNGATTGTAAGSNYTVSNMTTTLYANAIPALTFTYTGNYTIGTDTTVKTGASTITTSSWRVNFLTNGTLTITNATNVKFFAVGGGAGGTGIVIMING